MEDYDPKAIHGMAGRLDTVAGVVLALYGVAAALTALTMIVAGAVGGGQIQATVFLIGLVYGAAIFGAGYLTALGLRVAAQFMRAIGQIEHNTRAHAMAQVRELSDPIHVTDSGSIGTSRSRPADVREMLEASGVDSEQRTP